ncbi:hypothetical protein VP01_1877g4 [Puccinia sorghi]|uniref:Uncharacterized protein n=1 Tax=Puccinia sorghi TaxID=27349 RepID=A0A0L6VDN1_9BASI|nr:hypothetical protein VP01_1877g4 [Puccinia sorghi]
MSSLFQFLFCDPWPTFLSAKPHLANNCGTYQAKSQRLPPWCVYYAKLAPPRHSCISHCLPYSRPAKMNCPPELHCHDNQHPPAEPVHQSANNKTNILTFNIPIVYPGQTFALSIISGFLPLVQLPGMHRVHPILIHNTLEPFSDCCLSLQMTPTALNALRNVLFLRRSFIVFLRLRSLMSLQILLGPFKIQILNSLSHHSLNSVRISLTISSAAGLRTCEILCSSVRVVCGGYFFFFCCCHLISSHPSSFYMSRSFRYCPFLYCFPCFFCLFRFSAQNYPTTIIHGAHKTKVQSRFSAHIIIRNQAKSSCHHGTKDTHHSSSSPHYLLRRVFFPQRSSITILFKTSLAACLGLNKTIPPVCNLSQTINKVQHNILVESFLSIVWIRPVNQPTLLTKRQALLDLTKFLVGHMLIVVACGYYLVSSSSSVRDRLRGACPDLPVSVWLVLVVVVVLESIACLPSSSEKIEIKIDLVLIDPREIGHQFLVSYLLSCGGKKIGGGEKKRARKPFLSSNPYDGSLIFFLVGQEKKNMTEEQEATKERPNTLPYIILATLANRGGTWQYQMNLVFYGHHNWGLKIELGTTGRYVTTKIFFATIPFVGGVTLSRTAPSLEASSYPEAHPPTHLILYLFTIPKATANCYVFDASIPCSDVVIIFSGD